MERAILEESEHPEHAAIGAAALETETLLDGPAWEQADELDEPEAPGSLGRLRVESVGRASATADGAVRVELVLADEDGRRSAVALTFRIDPLLGGPPRLMRKRIGIYTASEEALQLLPWLESNPDVEIGAVFDPDPEATRERLRSLERGLARTLETHLSSDLAALAADTSLYAVVDASPDASFAARFPEVAERGVQIVTPLVARLLWGYGGSQRDRKAELLQALNEVVESYNLTVDADELFRRMLEIALSVTGAEGGSLMLLDAEARELRVRVAAGVEPELWPKIRVRIGEGIAGRVAADARPLRLRGKADRQAFRIVRERLDVESALCVPLVHEGRVLGVLNLHHSTRTDAFSDADLEFTEQLAQLDAKIIARAQEHEVLRNQAARYAAVREVRGLLGAKTPLAERLHQLCALRRAARGTAAS